MTRVFWAFVLLAACGDEETEPEGTTTTETPDEEDETPREAVEFPGPRTSMEAQAALVDGYSLFADYENAPAGIDPVAWRESIPEDNQLNAARVALGRKLYFDERLSSDGTVACATCHDAAMGFTDHRGGSEGIGGQVGRRNAPTTLNAALLETQFWDGRAPNLEEQAKLPIVNPIEMGQPNGEAATAAIASDPEYVRMFQEAYGRAPNYDDIGRAIASFERTLIFLDAPFDRFLAGEADAIGDDAKAGWTLFNGKARCVSCHMVSPTNPLFTDNRFHNIGVAARVESFSDLARQARASLAENASEEAVDRLALETDSSELGRFLVTRNDADIGAFRTPQLRNIALTAPYMHDGSMSTLWDVMDHYNKGGEPNSHLDGGIIPLALTELEIAQVIAFMVSLTSDRLHETGLRETVRQRDIARERRPFRDDAIASRSRIVYGEVSTEGGPGSAEPRAEGGDDD
jgi:cytochrome c peroxidase